jgi:cysteine-rich repeat protein
MSTSLCNRRRIIIGIIIILASSNRMPVAEAQPPECYDAPNGSPPRGLPLCGNGILDGGEICDDGNQINFDGCNAFCSAFDAMPSASTLAGGTSECPNGKKPVLGGSTSQVQFCNLRAIDTALDGSYVVLADGGTLMRFDLFTDALKGSIRQLEASIDRVFSDNICSVAVIGPDSSILVHDCGAQQLFVALGGDGSHVQMVADWSDHFAPEAFFKAYYNKAQRTAVVAGTLLVSTDGVIGIERVNISAFENFSAFGTTLSLAVIPRTAYNVWEEGTKRASMDVGGMEPRAVLYEACPPTFRALQMCYAVYMERPVHMEFMRAYIPENGGMVVVVVLDFIHFIHSFIHSFQSSSYHISFFTQTQDMEFYSYTSNLMDNALGHPLTRYGGGGNSLVYTLRGACFQIESRILTEEGKAPPVITMGNTCKQVPRIGIKCALPLNNPFLTDVITTPILLPDGLSASHTHLELSLIFGSKCPPTQFELGFSNESSSSSSSMEAATQMSDAATGPRLYQSVLRAAYASTLPVDFVELAGVLDVVYVTPTSVGLISTKRTLLYDRTQPGYARATNLIHCPKGQFGTVGGVCQPCAAFVLDAGVKIPVAYQIQCDGGEFETFSVVSSKNISTNDIRDGLCVYAAAKNGTCSPDVSLAPQQPFNMAADTLDALEAYGKDTHAAPLSLVKCLVTEAERTTGRALFRPIRAEYNARVVSQGQHILAAAAKSPIAALFGDSATIDTDTAHRCRSTLVWGVGSFLQCMMRTKVGSQQEGVVAYTYSKKNWGVWGASHTNGNDKTKPDFIFFFALLQKAGQGRRLLQAQTQEASLFEHQGPVYASNNPISWSKLAGSDYNSNNQDDTASTRRDGNSENQLQIPLWALILIISAAIILILSVATYMLLHHGHSVRTSVIDKAARTSSAYDPGNNMMMMMMPRPLPPPTPPRQKYT